MRFLGRRTLRKMVVFSEFLCVNANDPVHLDAADGSNALHHFPRDIGARST